MITSNSGSFVGGVASGIWTPGTVMVGGQSTKPSIPAIDLTSADLDPRVTYTGPAHLSWNLDGELEMCAVNEWPFGFRGYETLGRHEPEPAATNLQYQSRVTAVGDYIKTSGIENLLVNPSGAPDGGAIGLAPIECDVYAFSQDIGGAYLLPPTPYSLSPAWQRITFSVTTTARSVLRLWFGRNSTTGMPALWGTQGYLAAGTYTASFYVRSNDGSTFRVGMAQLESGALATSPIVTADTQVSRSAASVVVDTTEASSMTVHYSNGERDTYATPENTFTIPPAQRNWGERYMQRIEFR